MNDFKLEERKEKFQKCSFSLLETREKFNLTLRKQKLDERIQSRRKQIRETDALSPLEVNPVTLNVDEEYKSFNIRDLRKDIESLMGMLRSNNRDYVKLGLYALRKFSLELKGKFEYNDIFLSNNIIDILLDLIKESLDAQINYEALWILLNLTYLDGLDPNILNRLTEDDCLDLFYKFIKSPYEEIMDDVVWLLSHLVTDLAVFRDKVINHSIYDEIWSILNKNENTLGTLRYTLWFMSAIMRNKDTVPSDRAILNSLTLFSNYIYTHDVEVMAHCLWGLFYIIELDDQANHLKLMDKIMNSGVVVKIFKLNLQQNTTCLPPAIRLLGNLCGGEYHIVDELLSLRIIDFYDSILQTNKNCTIKKEILWGLSNIAAGNYTHVKSITDAAILNVVIDSLFDSNYLVKREAAYVIKNCSSCTMFDVSTDLVEKGVLEGIKEILDIDTCPQILLLCLVALKDIFSSAEKLQEVGGPYENIFKRKFELMGGSASLDRLTQFEHPDVENLARALLLNYIN